MVPTLFSAEINEIKTIYNVLKAIPPTEFAIFRPLEEGLKITIENSKTSEITVYIPTELFSRYEIAPGVDIMFKVQFRTFTDALHIYGDEGNPIMKMTYKQYGSPFCLVIKHSEENITVDCEFATMNVDDFQEVYLLEECNVNSIVFNGEPFVEVLNDLDMFSDEYELVISNQAPYFRIATTSTLGESIVDISKNSSVIAIFNCKEEFRAKYNFVDLRNIMKVMAQASKISLTTGRTSLLGLNLLMQSDEKRLYVEYYFTAQFEDETI